jgi:hypothetical protein
MTLNPIPALRSIYARIAAYIKSYLSTAEADTHATEVRIEDAVTVVKTDAIDIADPAARDVATVVDATQAAVIEVEKAV